MAPPCIRTIRLTHRPSSPMPLYMTGPGWGTKSVTAARLPQSSLLDVAATHRQTHASPRGYPTDSCSSAFNLLSCSIAAGRALGSWHAVPALMGRGSAGVTGKALPSSKSPRGDRTADLYSSVTDYSSKTLPFSQALGPGRPGTAYVTRPVDMKKPPGEEVPFFLLSTSPCCPDLRVWIKWSCQMACGLSV